MSLNSNSEKYRYFPQVITGEQQKMIDVHTVYPPTLDELFSLNFLLSNYLKPTCLYLIHVMSSQIKFICITLFTICIILQLLHRKSCSVMHQCFITEQALGPYMMMIRGILRIRSGCIVFIVLSSTYISVPQKCKYQSILYQSAFFD